MSATLLITQAKIMPQERSNSGGWVSIYDRESYLYLPVIWPKGQRLPEPESIWRIKGELKRSKGKKYYMEALQVKEEKPAPKAQTPADDIPF